MEAGDMDKTLAVIAEAKELFIRVKTESKDLELCQLALNMEAFCALSMGKAEEVIDLLDETSNKIISTETLLASAYQMVGRPRQAKSVLQVGIYQHMGSLFDELTDYLLLCTDAAEEFEETYQRALVVAKAFDLENLHPAILLKFHINAAQGYLILGKTNKALEILEEYTGLVTADIYPLQLKGDAYFNLLDDWIDDLDLGTALPRDEKSVRQSMVDSIINNPTFLSLAEEDRFQKIKERLKNNLYGGGIWKQS